MLIYENGIKADKRLQLGANNSLHQTTNKGKTKPSIEISWDGWVVGLLRIGSA